MSLCQKYNCEKCIALKDCGGCEKCNGFPFGTECVAATIIKNKGYNAYLEFEAKIIDCINNLHFEDLHITSLNCMPGKMVNLEYEINGNKVKLLDDNKTYFVNQIERKNINRCYGVASDGNFIVVSEYGLNGSDPKLLIYKPINL